MSRNEKEIGDIGKRLSEVTARISTLEWDLSHNQLNEGKKAYYDRLKKEKEELERELSEAKKE
ncbi:hypothetical protein COV21_01595 [Candidatus Woesearchaeota archaeon CG10_big_fil_rev_8_21_14_0_10_45_5]|jgi:hypothetical protein|nr:MAG: hypothetical protein COV21_01595 [Candidatus Woesearchaeota archaeon CG10_big_fil_rev_8_21_14_0_10_45_5]